MSKMPEAATLDIAQFLLEDRKFYVVYGETEEDEEPGWRVAWWDGSDQDFYDTRGEKVYRDGLEFIPYPLPER